MLHLPGKVLCCGHITVCEIALFIEKAMSYAKYYFAHLHKIIQI